jgi:hypothetical protein
VTGSNFVTFYSIFSPEIFRMNIKFVIWVLESSKTTIVHFKNPQAESDRCPYTEDVHIVRALLGDGGFPLYGLTTVLRE